MKQSGVVQLVLLGSAFGLYAYSSHTAPHEVRQQRYASREDCIKDWGDPDDCPAQANGPVGQTFFLGPRYYWNPQRNLPMVLNADGSEHVATAARVSPGSSAAGLGRVVGNVSRSGFGSFGRGFGVRG
jgi:hypothetical protein